MFHQLVRITLTGVALLALACVAVFLFLAWRINRTGSHDQTQPADAIVVLGARVQPDGEAGPDLRSRTLHGVRLFQRGMAPFLICTGGYKNDRLSAASVARDLAVAQGVPSEKVLLADGAMTTQEDAISTQDLLARRGLQTAILVSHPLHLERARILFEGQGITVYASPTSTDLAAIPWRSRAWLSVRETVGIISSIMETWGLPHGWTTQLSRWIYGPPTALGSETN
jgi:uncharacterized SAM-binding protein YcdF (DUF218 family)